MAKIKLLNKSVSELIAAGEVIERPVSVIKEIVENSIDAGAKSVTVEIKSGGISFMRVTDDGCGIEAEDMPTAFLRHATSKVEEEEDLEHICTLGFRGEALASIAAVARVELMSRRAENPLGSVYRIAGGEEEYTGETGCPVGTTIIIRDLFYNTPARLKFLKKDVTEGNSIQSCVDRLALAHPDVSFRLIRDNKQVLLTSGDGNYYSAVYSVFGKQFAASLISVDYSQYGIKVEGYISSPLFPRANRTMQNFFVNGRYIKSTTVMAAVEEGFRGSLMVGKFPAAVLNITINPSNIDINISPSKTEVRFSNDRAIFDTVYFAVKNAILNADNTKEIKLDKPSSATSLPQRADTIPSPVVQSMLTDTARESSPIADKGSEVTVAAKSDETEEIPLPQPPPERNEYDEREERQEPTSDKREDGKLLFNSPMAGLNVQPLPEYNIPPAAQKNEPEPEPEMAQLFRYINKSSFAPKEKSAPVMVIEPEEKPKVFRYIGELWRTYILCEEGDDFFLIDKHAAHERINYERLKSQLRTDSQLLAENVEVSFDAEHYNALIDNEDMLSDIGIDIIAGDGFKVEVTAMPVMLTGGDAAASISKLADIVLTGNDNGKEALLGDILHSMACKSSIRAHEVTSDIELETLARRVLSDKEIRFCPHGRPVVTRLSKYEIEKKFGRIQ